MLVGLLAAAGIGSITGQENDRSQADAPGSWWNPVLTQNIDTTLPGAAVPPLQYRAFTVNELKNVGNPALSTSAINPSEFRKNQLGRSWRDNPYPGVEMYVTPLNANVPWASDGARGAIDSLWNSQATMWASKPRQDYLRWASPALNSGDPVVIPLQAGVGDAKFFRASYEGELRARIVAGTARVNGWLNVRVIAFKKVRNLARFVWTASAPPGQSGPFSGSVEATILGRPVKTWAFSASAPIRQSLGSVDLTDQVFFFNGSYSIPWLNRGLAFGTYLDEVTLAPRVGVGPASALVELAGYVKARAYAELPIYQLFYGLLNLKLRLDSDILAGQVRVGEGMSVQLVGGRGQIRDSRYIASEANAGGGVLKLKVETAAFKIPVVDWGIGSQDHTLAKIIDWKGFRIARTLTSRDVTKPL